MYNKPLSKVHQTAPTIVNRVVQTVLRGLVPVLLTCILASAVQAKEAVSSIEFVGIHGSLLNNVNKHVRLVSRLNDPDKLRASERRRLQRSVADEVRQALEPFGYYSAQVSRDLSADESVLRYVVDLREPVRINSLTVTLNGQDDFAGDFLEWRQAFSLKTGEVLNQVLYEQHKKSLLAQALKLGYFDANFATSEILINQQRTQADITLAFVSGQRYALANVAIVWRVDEAGALPKNRIDDKVLSPLISIKPGQLYSAEQVNKSQRALAEAPFFASVEVELGELDQERLQVPVSFKVSPRKRKAFNFELGVGTDTGIRGGVGYEDRRINSAGHTVNARIGASDIARSALFNYRIPQPREGLESANIFASNSERLGGIRRFESDKIGLEVRADWRDADLIFGLAASRERSSRLNDQRVEVDSTTDLLVPSVRWERNKVDDLYFPTKGWSASATVRGTNQSLISDVSLVQGELDLKRLFPVGEGRFKLRLRLAGSLIDDASKLPESLGFLAGGDDSVRGYSFESIGVERNGETTVGKKLIVISAEYQHPIREGLALATFIDAGDAFDGRADFKKGAGMGLRWRLPFGALRLDVASGLDLDGDPLRLHFSFGTDL